MLGTRSATVRVHGLEDSVLSTFFPQGPAGHSGCAVGHGVLGGQRGVSDSGHGCGPQQVAEAVFLHCRVTDVLI